MHKLPHSVNVNGTRREAAVPRVVALSVVTLVVCVASAALFFPRSVNARASGTPPLVGVNYNHYAIDGCELNGGLLQFGDFGHPEIRAQLAAMHAAGIQTLRLFIWHMHDAGSQPWGVVSSAGGVLTSRARANLIWYLQAVRDAGFAQLSVVFGPEWTNNPIGFPDNMYDPTLFDENWNLIRTVRPIVKQYGPPSTHFDLLNEGAPSDYLATKDQLAAYDARVYTNYVDAFGNGDVTISSIVAWNDQSRLANLIQALRDTGRPLPTWFEIHAGGPTLLQDLQATDETLRDNGLSQPLVLGETDYNDPASAAAIRDFVTTSQRSLAEVMAWPLRPGSGCGAVSVAPPYRADEYIRALTGTGPATDVTVTLRRDRRLTATAPDRHPLLALEAGSYTFHIQDLSPTDNVHLVGPGINLKTSIHRGSTVTWSTKLSAGTYRLKSDTPSSKVHASFAVLATN
jgi:hypothetical protein